MNPQDTFCPNIDCPARGQTGKGNIGVHSQKDKRYKCNVCDKTFSHTKETIFYRLQTDAEIVMIVIALLAYGCPVQAIVKAYGFDERTVKSWWRKAGKHCEGVHNHLVGSSQQDLEHVQADEIKVKKQGGHFWMALAMMVSTRLWLGGAISPKRDLGLIQTLANQIRQIALCRKLLLAVDGLASYVKAFRRAFRTPVREGKPGRPRLNSWPGIHIVQVIKRRSGRKLEIERRIVQGSKKTIKKLLEISQNGGKINTSYIERLNATFRQRLSWLARRTRNLAQQAETLKAGMYIVGALYNFCDVHHSLRLKLSVGKRGYRWVQRTPAMAAGLSDHRWTVAEIFHFKVPVPRWSPPKCRGRPSKATLKLVEEWCQ